MKKLILAVALMFREAPFADRGLAITAGKQGLEFHFEVTT
jgi:hypothetical protein